MGRKKAQGIGILGLVVLCCVCIGGIESARSFGLVPATTATKSPPITQVQTQGSPPQTTQSPAATSLDPSPAASATDLPTNTPIANRSLLPLVTNLRIPNIASAACLPRDAAIQKGQVVSVIDGDTINVQLEDGEIYQLRYIGMDTPERGENCSGPASSFNQALVAGKAALLVMDVSEVDRYDRLLRYVIVDDIFVNYELVLQGYAQQSIYPPDVACVETFLEAQNIARQNGRGCWAAMSTAMDAPTQAPQPTSEPKAQGSNCDPSYPTVCLKMNAGDYDCAGGSGNGPNYVQGPIKVLPPDPFGLDRDGNGIGCEK
jgi:endonuclease YncB( thermonuclease family)